MNKSAVNICFFTSKLILELCNWDCQIEYWIFPVLYWN